MGDTQVEFIARFHNLEGGLVSERKKNFSKLLRDKSLLPNEEQLKIVLRDLQPKTYLESLLRIDIMIHFKKTAELLEVIKEGNEVFISKIIKEPWFLKDAFKEIDADQLVNEFLPCTSFTIRTKILKRLSRTLNEAQMDNLFDCVLKRYGLHVATNIVHSCSSVKILEVLSDNEIHLRPNQVKILFDRDPNLFKSYLIHYESITQTPYKQNYVFKYIALKNPQLFLELRKELKLNTEPLGRRLSKKMMTFVKDEVTNDVTSYTSLLKYNVIVRSLQGNFKNVYFNLFPKKLDEINVSNLCNKLLRFYPKNRQWDLFTQTFSQVFDNQTITDNLQCLPVQILNICTDIELKQRWAEFQYNKTNDNSFLKYYEPAKAIPLIKDKINVCSVSYKREELLKIMIDSCREYNDMTALEKVLEYALSRLRNDNQAQQNRQSFFYFIHRFGSLENLSENHWKYLNEIVEIGRIKKTLSFHFDLSSLMTKYLEFLFKNGKPFRKELSLFVEETVSAGRSFWLQINNGAIEKEILIQILNIIPDKVHEESSNYKSVYQQLTLDVFNFSLLDCNAQYCIRLLDFPHLITFIKSVLDKRDTFDKDECTIIEKIVRYNRQFPQNAIMIEKARLREIILTVSMNQHDFNFKNLLEFMLKKKNRSELENEILKLYFDEITNKHVSHSISFWFLKNEPEVLVPHVKKIVTLKGICVHSSAPYDHISYLKEIKLCSHLNIDVAFIDFLQEQLKDANCELKEDIMRYLSILLPTDGFIKVVSEYFLPKKAKLDLGDKEMKKVYKSQCEIAKILRDVLEPVKMLPIVMKFCIGDYLQSALRSLYSVCYRSSENKLYLYMDILSKRAVSARKHAVFISCALLDYKYAVNQLKATERSNISSQKHIFSATQKYFLRNQSEDLLELLISNMSTIDKNDTETFNSLSSIKVPRKFQVLYMEKCWQFFESMRQNITVVDYLNPLLRKINASNDVIVSLSSDFCKHVMRNYFEQKVDNLSSIELYVCKVLRYRELERHEYFDFVFKIISTFKVNNKLELITRFFNEFYSFVSSEGFNADFVSLFRMYWERCFTPVEMFKQYVLLKLLQLKCDSPLVKNYAENVAIFVDQLVAEYGLYVCNPFKLLLKRVLTSNFDQQKDMYLFFYYFLKYNLATTSCILVIDLMDKVHEDTVENSKEDREIFRTYQDILHILREVQVPIVKVYYKSYVKEI